MHLATLRLPGNTGAAVAVTGGYVPLPASDVGDLLARDDWRDLAERAAEDAAVVPTGAADLAPLLPRAGKVICCGLNYADHIREVGRELPRYPTLFAKYADTLVGARDTVVVRGSAQVDWEAELAVVVGATLRDADTAQAADAVAGYTVANDVSMRDWQSRTLQWFQGKAFDATTPLGPVLATPDECPVGDGVRVRGYVNGELVQDGDTSELVFSPADLLAYISRFTVLRPGDVVLTGTPGGVGMGMDPPRYLADGDVLTTRIDGIGRLDNPIRIHPISDTHAGPDQEERA